MIVSVIYNAKGDTCFINAWDLSTDSETGGKFVNTDIYGTVSDNAASMVKMGNLIKHQFWHSNCNSHTAKLLAKDITDAKLTENVTNVLKEFKHTEFEKRIIAKDGHRIKIPCETRCNNFVGRFTITSEL
ncbi:uncharacterized protein BDFB_012725 [Asbolus verrucosus]|uniref:DUF659 domain-containing protein n=1 Tax=Asbolus verrucosus TaxID=1661398 RepID=A0A482VVI5_ASBVE|nr:uncharacterized protein BDFB_012725 [Asbolus verrucosus]